MATSTITLYKNTKILPEYNYKVDGINFYLGNFSSSDKKVISNFQYIKHGLYLSVKIDLTQDDMDFIGDADNFNYCLIKNSNEGVNNHVYYFILKKTWLSQSTIQLSLKMDTINSLFIGTHYGFSNRTMINRQHKDRYKKYKMLQYFNIDDSYFYKDDVNYMWVFAGLCYNILKDATNPYIEVDVVFRKEGERLEEGTDYTITYSYNPANRYVQVNVTFLQHTAFDEITMDYCYIDVEAEHWMNNIDLYSEGLTPLLYKKDEALITQDLDVDWYLVYRTRNDYDPDNPDAFTINNPVDCFLCTNQHLLMNIRNSEELCTIDANILQAGKPYVLNIPYNFKDSNDVEYFSWFQASPIKSFKNYFAYKQNASDTKFDLYYYQSYRDEFVKVASQITYIKFPNTVTTINGRYMNSIDFAIDYQSGLPIGGYPESISPSSPTITVELNSIDDIDRTDARLIKIIKLPYCPSPYKYYSDTNLIDLEGWEFDATSHLFKLISGNTKFDYNIRRLIGTYDYFSKLLPEINFSTARTTTLKDEKYETKLYHSDYYQPKFVYDSFGFIFKLEQVDIHSLINLDYWAWLQFDYTVTTTINSRFMFSFPTYVCPKFATEDYYNILPVARNNEITLYNSQYLNYLRTGYNYDVKNKTRTEARSWIGTALQVVGAIASFASTPVTGGMGIVGGISLTTSTVMSLVNSVNTTAQNEYNIEAKKIQLGNQNASVYGSDDVDLMSKYTSNRAKVCYYEVSPKLKKLLFDLFYFTGYVAGFQDIPDTTSRTWFNFVSCDPVFEYCKNISEEALEDLRQRWKDGVTIMHRHNGTWDWDRQYENWETILNIPD